MHILPVALLQLLNSIMTSGILLRIARCFGPIPGHLISTGWCNPAWNTSLPDTKLQPIPEWEGEMLLLGQTCLFSVYWSRMAWLPGSIGCKWPEWWGKVQASSCQAHEPHTKSLVRSCRTGAQGCCWIGLNLNCSCRVTQVEARSIAEGEKHLE